MQDVNRLKKARDDAAHAEARARELEQQRRERTQRDQLQAMQKANATAADQAAKAKQTVSAGLKTLASQAGAVLGQVLQSSPQPPALPDETISSNQRLAASMAKRRGIGDLPRFTTDAINTDPAKAIPEIADLLRQVHASDPAQANDLFSQTMQGIAPEHGQALQRAMQSYGQSDSKKQDGVNADQISEADFMASPVYPVSANFGVREPASVQAGQKTPPPDPGQDDPEEPTEPKDPKQSNEEFCRRLRIQLEVDGANLDAARKRFDEANDRYNSIEAKLSPELTARDEARKHALIDMVPLVKPIRRGLKLGHVEARDFIGPVMDGVEIVDHSLKLGPLQKEFADALAERNDRQQDVENARDQVEKTLDELEAKGCK